MSLVALDGSPLIAVGGNVAQGLPLTFSSIVSLTMDALNEAAIFTGHVVTDDGASHTIDTTGSSAIKWRSGSVTFSNAGTTFKAGIATVDAANGPPARPVNVSNAITFDVAAVFTGGGGGVTANAWQSSVPTTGTKTIANGDLVSIALQMTARGGTDAVIANVIPTPVTAGMPVDTVFAALAFSNSATLPNVVIVFSDGHLGWLAGSQVFSTLATTTYNSGSTPNEHGNLLQFPFPTKAYGAFFGSSIPASADFDVVLYGDPLGTPAALATVNRDANVINANASAHIEHLLFSSPVSLTANTPYAIVVKPTTVNSLSIFTKSFATTAERVTDPLGANCYGVNRSSGAFAAANSGKDRHSVGLLLGAFDNAAGGGGLLVNQGLSGGML